MINDSAFYQRQAVVIFLMARSENSVEVSSSETDEKFSSMDYENGSVWPQVGYFVPLHVCQGLYAFSR